MVSVPVLVTSVVSLLSVTDEVLCRTVSPIPVYELGLGELTPIIAVEEYAFVGLSGGTEDVGGSKT